jgi:hypothetical protein
MRVDSGAQVIGQVRKEDDVQSEGSEFMRQMSTLLYHHTFSYRTIGRKAPQVERGGELIFYLPGKPLIGI